MKTSTKSTIGAFVAAAVIAGGAVVFNGATAVNDLDDLDAGKIVSAPDGGAPPPRGVVCPADGRHVFSPEECAQ